MIINFDKKSGLKYTSLGEKKAVANID